MASTPSSSDVDSLRSYFRRVHEALLFPQSYLTKSNASILTEESTLVGVSGDTDEISPSTQSSKLYTSSAQRPSLTSNSENNQAFISLRTGSPNTTPSTVLLTNTTKTILFRVEKYSWLIEGNNRFHMVEWTGYGPPPVEIKSLDCTVLCDVPTMKSIAVGQLRPMNAILTGKVVLKGDKNVFKDYQIALRLAVLPTAAAAAAAAAVGGGQPHFNNRTDSSTTSTVDPTYKYSKDNIYVEIVSVEDGDRGSRLSADDETASSRMSISSTNDAGLPPASSRNSFLNLRNPNKLPASDNNSEIEDNVTESKRDKVVRYVLQVNDRVHNTEWTVSRRYSEFITLRRTLLSQGYVLPEIRGPNSYLHSRKVVISQRVVSLALFVNETVRTIGLHNAVLNDFLGISNSPTTTTITSVPGVGMDGDRNRSVKKTDSRRSKASQAAHTADATSLHAVLNHAFAKKITSLTPHLLQHASYMVDEVKTLQQRVTALERQLPAATPPAETTPVSWRLRKRRNASLLLVHIHKVLFFLCLVVLAYGFYLCYHPFQSPVQYSLQMWSPPAATDSTGMEASRTRVEEKEVCVVYTDYVEETVAMQALNGTFFKYDATSSSLGGTGGLEVAVGVLGSPIAASHALSEAIADGIVEDNIFEATQQEADRIAEAEDVVKESFTPTRVCYFVRTVLTDAAETTAVETFTHETVDNTVILLPAASVFELPAMRISMAAVVLYFILLALPHLYHHHTAHHTQHEFHPAVLLQVFLVMFLAWDLTLQQLYPAAGNATIASRLLPGRVLVWMQQLEAKHVTVEAVVQAALDSSEHMLTTLYKTPITHLLFMSLPQLLSNITVLGIKVLLHFVTLWERVVVQCYGGLLWVVPLPQCAYHIAVYLSVAQDMVSLVIHVLLVVSLLVMLTVYLRYGGRYLSVFVHRLYLAVLGFLILSLYSTLSLSCKLCQLADTTRHWLFGALDQHLAPYVITQCLRPYYHGHKHWAQSKFAHWLTSHSHTHNHSDRLLEGEEHAFYWSEVWYEELQHLLHSTSARSTVEESITTEDVGKCSAEIQQLVENELNALFELVHDRHHNPTPTHTRLALGDVFDTFDFLPLSAHSPRQGKDVLHRVFQARINTYNVHNVRIKAYDTVMYHRKLGATEDLFEYSQLKQFPPSSTPSQTFAFLPGSKGATAAPTSMVLSLLHSSLAIKPSDANPAPLHPLLETEYLADHLQAMQHHPTMQYSSENKAIVEVAVKLSLPQQISSNLGLDAAEETLYLQQDLSMLQTFVSLLCVLDNHWLGLSSLLASMAQGLQHNAKQCDARTTNYISEATTMMDITEGLHASGLGVQCPTPIPALVSPKMLVMSLLPHTTPIMDEIALRLYAVDREAVLRRLTHSFAYQLLVHGLCLGDAHPRHVLLSLCTPHHSRNHREDKSRRNLANTNADSDNDGSSSEDDANPHLSGSNNSRLTLQPALLDNFSCSTIRLPGGRRRQWCALFLSLFEGDHSTAGRVLKELGFTHNLHGTDGTPSSSNRDAEFFEHLFRDAAPRPHKDNKRSKTTVEEEEEEDLFFAEYRSYQRQIDHLLHASNHHHSTEDNGASSGIEEMVMADLPEDFLQVLRLLGMIRGLCAELRCHCPILHIFALHAKVGKYLVNADEEEEPKK